MEKITKNQELNGHIYALDNHWTVVLFWYIVHIHCHHFLVLVKTKTTTFCLCFFLWINSCWQILSFITALVPQLSAACLTSTTAAVQRLTASCPYTTAADQLLTAAFPSTTIKSKQLTAAFPSTTVKDKQLTAAFPSTTVKDQQLTAAIPSSKAIINSWQQLVLPTLSVNTNSMYSVSVRPSITALVRQGPEKVFSFCLHMHGILTMSFSCLHFSVSFLDQQGENTPSSCKKETY